jgi:hypothetical protein
MVKEKKRLDEIERSHNDLLNISKTGSYPLTELGFT